MKHTTYLAIVISSICFSSYALEPTDNSALGAKVYDWDTCINSKADPCITACSKSEDTSCQDNCRQLAKDKCIAEGVKPS